MPRSLLEILLEKKDPKKSLPYPTRDQFNMALDALITICDSTLSGLKGVELCLGMVPWVQPQLCDLV